jgi:ADP-ribose pyrophosphatase YjhB (NUDIX family)
MSAMIRMELPAGVFNHRIVGVVIEDGFVLLHRNIRDDFWALPGGRAELMEPSTVTIQREFQEELGIDVTVERLLWIVENFFTYEDRNYHELSMFYLVSLPEHAAIRDKKQEHQGIEQETSLIFRWFPVKELGEIPLYPSFLRSALTQLPVNVQSVIHFDNSDNLTP